MMADYRIRGSSAFLWWCLLISGAVIARPAAAYAQVTERAIELGHDVERETEGKRFADPSYESQEQANGPKATKDADCNIRGFARDTWAETGKFGHGLKTVPRAAIRASNLKWELPILAATGVLIAKVDRPAVNRIQSKSFQNTASRWSDAGLGIEIGSAVLAYGVGCGQHLSYLRETGFRALAAMGAAGAVDLALKLTFDRQFPFKPGSTGKFWGGGRAFPSGHSATSFAFAVVVAHRYPKKKWIKWGAYALATGVALSRYPAKKHFPSDILAGAMLGYVTGTYLAGH